MRTSYIKADAKLLAPKPGVFGAMGEWPGRARRKLHPPGLTRVVRCRREGRGGIQVRRHRCDCAVLQGESGGFRRAAL